MKVKKLLILLLILISCIFAFAGCGSSNAINSVKRHNIDTKLLNDYEIVCDVKGETFTGRAPCYGVFSFKNEPTAFLQSFSTEKSDGFSSEKNEKLEEEIENCIGGHTCMEIPEEYLPEWDDEYIWFVDDQVGRLDTLYMIYFPNVLRLVVFETGH